MKGKQPRGGHAAKGRAFEGKAAKGRAFEGKAAKGRAFKGEQLGSRYQPTLGLPKIFFIEILPLTSASAASAAAGAGLEWTAEEEVGDEVGEGSS